MAFARLGGIVALVDAKYYASKGREEVHWSIQKLCQLDSNHGASTRRLLKTLLSMTDAARLRPLIHRKKLD